MYHDYLRFKVGGSTSWKFLEFLLFKLKSCYYLHFQTNIIGKPHFCSAEHDSDTNCSMIPWKSWNETRKDTWEIGDLKKNWDYPDPSSAKIS